MRLAYWHLDAHHPRHKLFPIFLTMPQRSARYPVALRPEDIRRIMWLLIQGQHLLAELPSRNLAHSP